MKAISSAKWGASRRILKNYYIAHIRSKLDYGSILYNTASKTNLQKLDKIQNCAMRLITGGLKTTPILALEAETSIAPLQLQRERLIIKQYIKLQYSEGFNQTVKILEIKKYSGGKAEGPANSYMSKVGLLQNIAI